MGGNSNKDDLKVGEFLVKNNIISKGQLEDALTLQEDNSDRLLGEILVTQGVLTREDLVMSMEMFMMLTGSDPTFVDEWLDQDEIDFIIEKLKNK